MTTPSTTYPLVRTGWRAAMSDIAPSYRPGDAFSLMVARDERQGFREWAEANVDSCLRRYTIERIGQRPPALVSDGQIEQIPLYARLTVAYPTAAGNYNRGSYEGELDLENVLDSDLEAILAALGIAGGNNYVNGQSACFAVGREVERTDTVAFLVVELEAIVNRAVGDVTVVATQNSAEQSFVTTWTPAGTTFTVTIPTPMASASYIAKAWINDELAEGNPRVLVDKDGRTTTSFLVRAAGTVPDGTEIECFVRTRAS